MEFVQFALKRKAARSRRWQSQRAIPEERRVETPRWRGKSWATGPENGERVTPRLNSEQVNINVAISFLFTFFVTFHLDKFCLFGRYHIILQVTRYIPYKRKCITYINFVYHYVVLLNLDNIFLVYTPIQQNDVSHDYIQMQYL